MSRLHSVQDGKVVKAAVKALSALPKAFWDQYSFDDIRLLARPNKVIAISQATPRQLRNILGVEVPFFDRGTGTWHLDSLNKFDSSEACPASFQKFMTTMARHLPGTSEAALSSRVEVLHTQAALYLESYAPGEIGDAPFMAHGQCSLSYTNASGDTLTGLGDLFIGGTDQNSEFEKPQAHNITFVVEVKAAEIARLTKSQLQLWTYMYVIHQARRAAGKKNLQVFGVVTDSVDWRFMWINESGACVYTKWYQMALNRPNVRSLVLLQQSKLGSITDIPGYVPWVAMHDPEEEDIGSESQTGSPV
ncbi:hypothetical protein HDU86_007708 [Geranomyces michiganensis]|nr:hypothetical protein HDU86_007708 [Geranomyces michiganensis]